MAVLEHPNVYLNEYLNEHRSSTVIERRRAV